MPLSQAVQSPSTLLHMERGPYSLLFERAMVSHDQCLLYIFEQPIQYCVLVCTCARVLMCILCSSLGNQLLRGGLPQL